MGAHLGHEEHLLAFALESRAHPHFGLAAMILPAIIEECDAAIDGAGNDLLGGFLVLRVAKVMAAEAERRNFDSGFSELSARDLRHADLRLYLTDLSK